ncbi:hypothetical protein [Arthrobacter sp. ISL-30]|uniref:hypothetical protein n=1 Tax=Arthrobacter sp. ISL-30 TaxID=2819109 RepID=UPI002036197E|nr:hypothetical protein [Arthrobacter sp. ISL-30]
MAEHNGGNRGGNRGNFGGDRDNRGPFRANNNSGGDPRGFRARDGRPGDRDRKPYGDRPSREGGEGRGFGDRDRKPFGDRDRKPFGDRPRREGDGERRTFGGDRDRRPFEDRDRKPYGDRPRREGDGDRRSFGGDRDRKPFGDRDRKPFGDRPRREGDGDRRSFGGDRDRKPFGDRPSREGEGDRRSFGDRDRKPFGDRDRKPYGDRPSRSGEGDRRSFGDRDRKPFGDRPERGPRKFDGPGSGPRRSETEAYTERPGHTHNVADLRSSNRPDRERSPEIDEDVTGQELDRATKHQIKTLEERSADWVAKHLVMAGRFIDVEPELAFQHALAASRRGGRLSAVREAVGLTAYAAGHYGEALREFRTYRRISGSNVHLPIMADCERGLGRADRALDVVRSPEAQDLDAPGKVELAIVASGARADLGQLDAAVAELEIPQLDINRAFSYSPRLFRAYADALKAVGRTEEAEKWQRQAVVAENALGVGEFEEPDIIDLGWDEQEEEREAKARKPRKESEESRPQDEETSPGVAEANAAEVTFSEAPAANAGTVATEDVDLDDAETDYFESDDPESDLDSVEDVELEGNEADDDEDGSAVASSDLDADLDGDSEDFTVTDVTDGGEDRRND